MDSSDRNQHLNAGQPAGGSVEERLAARVRELERQLHELRDASTDVAANPKRPGKSGIFLLLIVILVAIGAAFATGYFPRHRVTTEVAREKQDEIQSAIPVRVAAAHHSEVDDELKLPGTIQPLTEAPVLARADGYVTKRYFDIGDFVKAGQVMAEIEAPELDQQARQAAAAVNQAKASLEQANASRAQAQSNQDLAQVTASRWANLLKRGVVSRQENDQQQAQLKAQSAGVAALDRAVDAARSNVAAAEANLARIEQLRGYLKVRAPFAGVVTMRGIDVGALVTSGNTLLYRLAETHTLRTYINVPQTYANSLKPGMEAELTVAERPSAKYTGRVVRSSNALDPATRTMLVEVQVANRDRSLLPGMFVQVSIAAERPEAPLLVEADAVEVRATGTLVACVGADQIVHERKVTVGRDFGKELEILSGLKEGELVIINPNDSVREGVKVNPMRAEAGKESKKGGAH